MTASEEPSRRKIVEIATREVAFGIRHAIAIRPRLRPKRASGRVGDGCAAHQCEGRNRVRFWDGMVHRLLRMRHGKLASQGTLPHDRCHCAGSPYVKGSDNQGFDRQSEDLGWRLRGSQNCNHRFRQRHAVLKRKESAWAALPGRL